jgi:hypothetical protein
MEQLPRITIHPDGSMTIEITFRGQGIPLTDEMIAEAGASLWMALQEASDKIWDEMNKPSDIKPVGLLHDDPPYHGEGTA